MTKFDLDTIDSLFHSKIRLAIMATLSQGHTPSFRDLKEFFTLTDGNLGANLKTLEKAGMLKSKKSVDGTPIFVITKIGQRRFTKYVDSLVDLLDGTWQ